MPNVTRICGYLARESKLNIGRLLAVARGTSLRCSRQPVFICGCGHSGTSLMLKLLGNHSKLYAVPRETGFACGRNLQSLAYQFDREALGHGKRRWVEKTPRHCYHINKLLANFPNGKIICLRRDARDVVASLLARGMNLPESISRWRDDNAAIDQFADHQSLFIVKYEALVTEIERVMHNVLAFIGVGFEDVCLAPERNARSFFGVGLPNSRPDELPGNHEIYRGWQVNQPLFDGRGRWKRDLSVESLSRIGNEIGAQMKVYGYPRE